VGEPRVKGKRGCAGFGRRCTLLKGISSPEDVRVSDDGRFVYLAAAEGVTGVVQLLKRH
jgi:hypothetical protein